MSQENVEIVRRVNEAFVARDMEALMAEHRRIVHEACAAERGIEVDTQLSGSLSLSAVSSTRPLVANVAFCRVLC
jgi:hypothetical protein